MNIYIYIYIYMFTASQPNNVHHVHVQDQGGQFVTEQCAFYICRYQGGRQFVTESCT